MPGTSSDAVGPTVMVALERRAIRSVKTSLLSVSLPPLAESWLTVRRRMSPAGTFTSKVRRRCTSMPLGPLTRTASVVRPTSVGLSWKASRLRSPAPSETARSKPGCDWAPGSDS